MDIIFSPQVREGDIVLHRYKDTLVINSEEFDFSKLSEGDVLPSEAVNSEYVIGDVTRVNGVISLTILSPVQWDAPVEAMFPEPLLNSKEGKLFDSRDYYEY